MADTRTHGYALVAAPWAEFQEPQRASYRVNVRALDVAMAA